MSVRYFWKMWEGGRKKWGPRAQGPGGVELELASSHVIGQVVQHLLIGLPKQPEIGVLALLKVLDVFRNELALSFASAMVSKNRCI